MPNLTREIIVYRIRTAEIEEFEAIKEQMIQESMSLEGLRSSTTAKVLGEPGVFADTMVWASHEAALAAKPAFENLPTAKRFLGLMTGPPLHHLFLEHQPDPIAVAAS